MNRERIGGRDTKYVLATANTMGMVSIPSAPVIYGLPSLILGGSDTFSQRIGRRINIKRIMFHGVALGAQTNSVADDAYNVIRVSVIIAEPLMAVGAGLNEPWDSRVQVGLKKVLFDQQLVIQAPAKDSVGYIAAAVPFEFDFSTSIDLEYVTAAAASPRLQNIFLVVASDSAAVVHPGFSASSYLTMTYVDR